jgi:hypothetical protein
MKIAYRSVTAKSCIITGVDMSIGVACTISPAGDTIPYCTYGGATGL